VQAFLWGIRGLVLIGVGGLTIKFCKESPAFTLPERVPREDPYKSQGTLAFINDAEVNHNDDGHTQPTEPEGEQEAVQEVGSGFLNSFVNIFRRNKQIE